jgi:plasmid stabilization system protein ParE
MTVRVIRSPRAAAEIREIAQSLAEESPRAAQRFLAALAAAQRQLSDFPNSGQRGVMPETRRLVVAPYILHCRRRDDTVEVFAVRHARRSDARAPR